MDRQFEILKEEIKNKNTTLSIIEKERVDLKHEIHILQLKLENVCNHKYIKEETMSGPYGEMTNICIKCNRCK
jgi:hypothetical protein